MNADLKQRLMSYARERIALQVAARRLHAGAGMTEQDGMLGLRTLPKVLPVVDEEDTWELVLFVRISWFDTIVGDGQTALTAIRVARVLGILNASSIWENQGQVIDAPSVPRTRYVTIEFYTRQFPDAPTGTPVYDEGREYRGTVRFTLREVEEPALADTGTSYEITIPPEGYTQTFYASETEKILRLTPTLDSIRRVRE